MRLGAPVFGNFATPEEWAQAARRAGYSAVYCPVDHRAEEQTIHAYAEAARRADMRCRPPSLCGASGPCELDMQSATLLP